MSPYKDQAAKLRVLAQKQEIPQKDEVLTFSSLMKENTPQRSGALYVVITILVLVVIGAVAAGVFIAEQNKKVTQAFHSQAQSLEKEVATLSTKATELEERSRSNLKSNQELSQQLQQTAALNTSLRDQLDKTAQEKTSLVAEVSAKEEQLRRIEQMNSDLKAQMQKNMEETSSKIAQLHAQVQEALVSAYTQPTAQAAVTQGEVIFINPGYNFVLVNLGKKDNMAEGVPLKVYRQDELVAELEIVQVRSDISAGDVRWSSGSIQIGDKVKTQ